MRKLHARIPALAQNYFSAEIVKLVTRGRTIFRYYQYKQLKDLYNPMDVLSQMLIGTVPALVVLFAAYFLFKYQLAATFDLLKQGSSRSEYAKVQVNFQAYERLVLYLERINPGNMVLRMHKNGGNAKMLEGEMVKSIREEFEHNLSQQIYVSDDIWKLIRQAKEETIKLISLASAQCSEKSSATDLSRILLELAGTIEEFPHDVAIRYLKQELRSKI